MAMKQSGNNENKAKRHQGLINISWIALTAVIALGTLWVSINTIGDMISTHVDRRVVEEKIEILEKKIEADSIFIRDITTSPEFMERFARETYHMQRQGETVYIME